MSNEEETLRSTRERAALLLTKNQKCIINTDIDGILCGLVLQNALDWKVIGFYNSKETLFIDNNELGSLNDAIYIDVFIAPNQLRCIDQHIVSLDETHTRLLSQNINKLNPNLQRIRYASDDAKDDNSYKWKYPFGTVHFVIASLESIGIKVELNLDGIFDNAIPTLDLILRADDAARTTTKRYKQNAKRWWSWLELLGGTITKRISDYVQGQNSEEAERAYDNLESIFKRKFECHTADGGFGKALKKRGGRILPLTHDYLRAVAAAVESPSLEIRPEFSMLSGKFLTCPSYHREKMIEILGEPTLFSYAVTCLYGRASTRGFSYTLWLPDGIPRP